MGYINLSISIYMPYYIRNINLLFTLTKKQINIMETKTQIKTSNKNAYNYAKNKEPFKANNLSAEITFNNNDQSYYYVIYSYDWYPLFIYNFNTHIWYENKVKYSATTSKQMTQVRPVFTANEMSNEMFKLFRKY